jgi:hypothetical protein
MRELWLEIWRAKCSDDYVRCFGNDADAGSVEQTFNWFCERLGITEFEDPPSVQALEDYLYRIGADPSEVEFTELG